MKFRCHHCQLTVGVRAVVWRVSVRGRASAGGQCERCGQDVLWHFSKLSDAPPDVAARAQEIEQVYQYWRRVRTLERDSHLRDIWMLLGRKPNFLDIIATAFGLRRETVLLIIRDG